MQKLRPITVMGYKCFKCGHSWTPKKLKYPKWCPHCKNTGWEHPKK